MEKNTQNILDKNLEKTGNIMMLTEKEKQVLLAIVTNEFQPETERKG